MNISRYIKLDDVNLGSGSHESPESGMCAMELVAWLAGEDHSDTPECVCPVIASYSRSLNDQLRDDERQLMKPALVACMGTRDKELESRRMYLCADHAVRIFAPLALDSYNLPAEAEKLRALRPVVDKESANAAYAAANAVYAAYAAYAAANAPYAAANAAYAAANAAYAAANAAYAAANAANAARMIAVQAAIDLLWDMIRMSWPDARPVVMVTETLEPVYA